MDKIGDVEVEVRDGIEEILADHHSREPNQLYQDMSKEGV
jgi:hypothetical protein